MLRKWQFWTLTVLASLILVLVAANMWLFLGNRSRQVEINQRQQFIQQSIQLEGLNREIVKALAELSVKNQDEQVKSLLASHGITFTVNPPPSTPGGPAESAPAKKGPK